MGLQAVSPSLAFSGGPKKRKNSWVDSETGEPVQAKDYEEAIKLGEGAKKANQIGVGAWGAIAAVCGYNCIVNYLVDLRQARSKFCGLVGKVNALSVGVAACPGA